MGAYIDAINEAVRAAFKAHNAITGLTNDQPDEVQVWHLILSLMEFCDHANPAIDFDEQIADARQHVCEDAS